MSLKHEPDNSYKKAQKTQEQNTTI